MNLTENAKLYRQVNELINKRFIHETLSPVMNVKVICFERLKEEYELCLDFKDIFLTLQSGQLDTTDGFCLKIGYLFKSNKLCTPKTLVWKIHEEGLARHFGRDKTIEEIKCHFISLT